MSIHFRRRRSMLWYIGHVRTRRNLWVTLIQSTKLHLRYDCRSIPFDRIKTLHYQKHKNLNIKTWILPSTLK